jgi:uncharacterized membrane protein (UPF0127 family)
MRRAILFRHDAPALSVEIAETLLERRRGLLGRSEFSSGGGMLFLHCRSVHTFGMRFTITVATLDKHLRVLEVRTVPPRRVVLPKRRVRHVLECGAAVKIVRGDRMQLRLVDDQLKEEGAEETPDDNADGGGGDDHQRHEPADGARKHHGLAASFGGPQAEDLEQLAHGIPSARTEGRLSEERRGSRLYFRG